ncbi:hypothetical protein BJ170DRAFT_725547 [Xylariales sp. AK1849]|nr:hypothetical protein BJ170DRAFT_725547 [Xylariales sp. AK1849]
MLTDFAHLGALSNSFTRPQNVTMAEFDVSSPLFEGDELSDLRSDDATLQPGALVEMRRPMLAVCLGRINGYEHYYTNSGKWFTGLGVKTLFVVNRFAQPAELEPIIAEIPAGDIPIEALNALKDLGHGPSRTAGAPLLRRMLDFTQESESVYQANAATLDASSSFIGDPIKHRYLTLHEIADLLLPFALKGEGKFSSAALYAVHRSLLQDEVFFRPLKQTGHRRSYLFEISPLSEVRIIQRMEFIVRDYLDTPADQRESPRIGKGTTTMAQFVTTARQVIDKSRKVREFTPHGIIGPSASKSPPVPDWSAAEIEILRFLELWASYQKFPNYSRLQCLGSAVLRALDRYPDMSLNPTLGWTFLQEVGWIPPWEIPSRYNVRFPEVEIKRGGSFVRPFYGMLDRHLQSDVFANDRKQWDNVTAYCIDAETTMDIDDAVSVERTSDPEKSWIHIHVADPASSLAAETPVAKYAELVPETVYLQGHFARMLPNNISVDRFSLAPGRPSLTFSALVNDQGALLDYKITPGVLRDVVYMTGEDVSEALGETREDSTATDEELAIGSGIKPKPVQRNMTRPDNITAKQKDELALLSQLGKALHRQRLKKGATPYFQARAHPEVGFDGVTQAETPNGFIKVTGDPSIRIAFSKRTGTDLVENTMRLAGEVAARWSSDRGIPIPYRTQPHATQRAAQIQQYTQDVFLPLLEAGTRPSDDHWRHLRSLLGSDEVSTTPGPYLTMGVDMYTKATSPLRRFSDLIVHWQIEATLLEEKKRGKSLVGNKDDSFLPFSKKRLDRMLPMLRVREKQARLLANGSGADQWILQALVRAWKFGEAKLPSTFQLTVAHIAGRRSILGRLNWFDRPAFLRPESLNDVAKMTEVRLGDVFEVRLQDVNVYSNTILVEAVRLLDQGELNHATATQGDVSVPSTTAP